MKTEGAPYTLLAKKKVLKPPEFRNRGCPYNFVTVQTLRISANDYEQLRGGNDEVLAKVISKFKESGVEGNVLICVALGGKGILASKMKNHVDWQGTGMPVIWKGSVD